MEISENNSSYDAYDFLNKIIQEIPGLSNKQYRELTFNNTLLALKELKENNDKVGHDKLLAQINEIELKNLQILSTHVSKENVEQFLKDNFLGTIRNKQINDIKDFKEKILI